MKKTVLYTFEGSEDRQKFIDYINDVIAKENNSDKEMMDLATKTAILDPSILSSDQRHCSIWVSGKKIVEGDYKQMSDRFMQECGVHSASVVLRELRNNEWCDIRARRLQ